MTMLTTHIALSSVLRLQAFVLGTFAGSIVFVPRLGRFARDLVGELLVIVSKLLEQKRIDMVERYIVSKFHVGVAVVSATPGNDRDGPVGKPDIQALWVGGG